MAAPPLIETIRERCRVCYTCIRECPAKAIRIAEGQARVIAERCVACGNCLRVCSQNAKSVQSAVPKVEEMLASGEAVAACLAPSFPAEFAEAEWRRVVGMLRALGFRYVHEVAFGADLVAHRYRRLLAENEERCYIATTCPAAVAYIEKYCPDLIPFLAPIASPMIALARFLRRRQPGVRLVFIGPCIAKKAEAAGYNNGSPAEVDAVLTFAELRSWCEQRRIAVDEAIPSDFDPPYAAEGMLFPVSRGLLHAAKIREDILAGKVLVADGRANFVEAIRAFHAGEMTARLLEILCCEGCIMGAGFSATSRLFAPAIFSRRHRVSLYARERLELCPRPQWENDMRSGEDVDLSQHFRADDQRIRQPPEKVLRDILARLGKHKAEDELNCGACGYDTCLEHAIAIYNGLAENEMCLPHTIDELRSTIKALAFSNEQLASAQAALMQSEKLASMGQLAAGIAHEVNNPLGAVIMYAHLLLEEAERYPQLKEDLRIIAEQADRCKRIVSGLLHFARQNKVVRQLVDFGALVERTLSALPRHAGVELILENRLADPLAEIDRDQIAQVIVNLAQNAIDAMPSAGVLKAEIFGDDARVCLRIKDSGHGIRPEILPRIFDPFFTTKPIGKGTGLGLAVSYGIVKMHRGEIYVEETNCDPSRGPTGTTFLVSLPRLDMPTAKEVAQLSEEGGGG